MKRHPAWFAPVKEWSPDDPAPCPRCGKVMRSGDGVVRWGISNAMPAMCIAKSRGECLSEGSPQ